MGKLIEFKTIWVKILISFLCSRVKVLNYRSNPPKFTRVQCVCVLDVINVLSKPRSTRRGSGQSGSVLVSTGALCVPSSDLTASLSGDGSCNTLIKMTHLGRTTVTLTKLAT